MRGLDAVARLTRAEVEALKDLPLRLVSLEPYEDLVHEGTSLHKSCLVVDGLLCRHKSIGGRRQILSLHLPGDIPDLHSLHLSAMDYSLGALTHTKAAFIQHQHIKALIRREPGLGAALWRYTLVDAAIHRAWLASIGRRTPSQRVAHLLCEIFLRLHSRQPIEVADFALPMTQVDMADALGLSLVHLNRTIRDLRRRRVLVSRGRYYGFADWDLLQETAEFDPTYLNLRRDNHVLA